MKNKNVISKQAWLLSSILVLALPVSAKNEKILLLNKVSGQETAEYEVTTPHFASRLGEVFKKTHHSVLAQLDAESTNPKWKTKAVIVGLGMKVEFGLGPVISAAVKPRYRLVYTKRGSKFFPDSF